MSPALSVTRKIQLKHVFRLSVFFKKMRLHKNFHEMFGLDAYEE
jgi:hypothetical protein